VRQELEKKYSGKESYDNNSTIFGYKDKGKTSSSVFYIKTRY
jgi:hypothetical protein